MFALLFTLSRFVFLMLSHRWIRQIIYKIKFYLQPNVEQFLNIYFLTTIRFFARFPRFVYTLYIQD